MGNANMFRAVLICGPPPPAQGAGKADKPLALLPGRIPSGIVNVRQHCVVMEQDPVEAGIAGQIFIDLRHLLANLRTCGESRI